MKIISYVCDHPGCKATTKDCIPDGWYSITTEQGVTKLISGLVDITLYKHFCGQTHAVSHISSTLGGVNGTERS